MQLGITTRISNLVNQYLVLATAVAPKLREKSESVTRAEFSVLIADEIAFRFQHHECSILTPDFNRLDESLTLKK